LSGRENYFIIVMSKEKGAILMTRYSKEFKENIIRVDLYLKLTHH